MNLSGIVIAVKPADLEEGKVRLQGLEGVDVHESDAATGKIVVTQEATSTEEQQEGLRRIQALPGVLYAQLVYYHCEESETES